MTIGDGFKRNLWMPASYLSNRGTNGPLVVKSMFGFRSAESKG